MEFILTFITKVSDSVWGGLIAFVLIALLLAALWWLMKSRTSWLQRGPKRIGTWSVNLLRAMRYLSTRREWRYSTPWSLLVGDTMSGKSSIVQSLDGHRRSDLLLKETRLAVADSEWAFFNNGVLIDIRSRHLDDPQSSLNHWRDVLADIDAQRPERPLDSVLLTLSAKDLLTPPPGGLQGLAERLYQRMFELQKRLSFNLPIYIVVTHCDVVDGFSAFWQAQPKARRKEMFGWSSPYSLDHQFDPDWVDSAFKHIGDDLFNAQLDAAAHRNIEQPDPFFLFPKKFNQLNAPLRTVLELVLKPASYHEDYPLRGVYFSGFMGSQPPTAEKATNGLVFLDHLFSQRIFRERNLARPTREGVWSRNRLIRRIQMTMVSLGAVMILMLAVTGLRLSHHVDASISGFNAISNPIHISDTQESCDRGRVDHIYTLLESLSDIDTDWRYLWIPASWFDNGVSIAAANKTADQVFRDIIFPSLRCRLENRASALVNFVPQPIIPSSFPDADIRQAQKQVSDYLNDVMAFETALDQYTRITVENAGSSRSARQALLNVFAQLSLYAYGRPLPESVKHRQGLQALALGYIRDTHQPKLPARFHHSINIILNQLFAFASNTFDNTLDLGNHYASQIETNGTKVDIEGFSNWLNFAKDNWLQSAASSSPCALMVSATEPKIRSLIENANYPQSLSSGLARFTTQTNASNATHKGCYADGIKAIVDTSIAPYGSVTKAAKTASKFTMAAWVDKELTGLKALRSLDFMTASIKSEFTCQSPLSGWNGARLAEASGYAHSYQSFREKLNLAPPQQVDADKKPLFDLLARRRLQRVLDDRVNRAQQRLTLADTASAWLSPLSTGDDRLGNRSRAFTLTAPQLKMVLGLYGQFNLDSQAIATCARNFANSELDAANRLVEASALYEPNTNIAALNLKDTEDTPAFFNIGSAAEGKEYLHQQLERAEVLAGYTQPFVRFLNDTQQATVGQGNHRQSKAYWQATINEVDRYVQGKDPKGQVALLQDLMLKQLRTMSQSNCTASLKTITDTDSGLGLFSARNTGLTSQASDYCTSGNKGIAKGDYQVLAKRFNAQLAGLFPFGPASNPDAPLAVTKRFFIDYLEQRQALRATVDKIGKNGGKRWQNVGHFLDQLDDAADFFKGSLAAGPQSQPLGLNVNFRYLPKNSDPAQDGSSQLVGWRFESADAQANYPNGNANLNWQFGDPVSLQLAWAGLSSYRPEEDDKQKQLEVEDLQARFSAKGPWSLLRLIEKHRETDSEVVDPLNDHRVITAYDVPLKFVQPPGTNTLSTAKLRLAMDLIVSDPTGKSGAQVGLPEQFPHKAPYLW